MKYGLFHPTIQFTLYDMCTVSSSARSDPDISLTHLQRCVCAPAWVYAGDTGAHILPRRLYVCSTRPSTDGHSLTVCVCVCVTISWTHLQGHNAVILHWSSMYLNPNEKTTSPQHMYNTSRWLFRDVTAHELWLTKYDSWLRGMTGTLNQGQALRGVFGSWLSSLGCFKVNAAAEKTI